MARRLTILCAFGFAFIAGATPFVMPWPVALFTAAALLLLFFALLEDCCLNAELEGERLGDNRFAGWRR